MRVAQPSRTAMITAVTRAQHRLVDARERESGLAVSEHVSRDDLHNRYFGNRSDGA